MHCGKCNNRNMFKVQNETPKWNDKQGGLLPGAIFCKRNKSFPGCPSLVEGGPSGRGNGKI